MSDITLNYLQEEKKRLLSYLKIIEQSKQSEPQGFIRVDKRNSGSFSIRYSSGDSTGIYLSVHKKKEITSLLQKKYNRLVEREINRQLIVIDRFLRGYVSNVVSSCYYRFDNKSISYIRPFEVPDEVYGQIWQETKYKGNSIQFNSGEFITERGECVRSKSEVIIANTLNSLNIPYRYEFPLVIENDTFFPDFTILQTDTRKIFYWEHFGKMGNDEYREKAFKKIDKYSRRGILSGKNLIITFEDSRTALSVRTVQKIAEALKSTKNSKN